MTPRRRARAAALQVLYAKDVDASPSADVALAMFHHHFGDLEDAEDVEGVEGTEIDRGFAEEIVRGVAARAIEIDEILAAVSRNWRLERMARVDRTILRMALWELRHRTDTPARVTLNEAIELAKSFGSAEAPAFVNGLLDSALHHLGRDAEGGGQDGEHDGEHDPRHPPKDDAQDDGKTPAR
jgi:N utilization substance protein B